MILVDTSVWIDYLRAGDVMLTDWLTQEQVLIHPFVIGELAMGSIADRATILRELAKLPAAIVAKHAEVRSYVDACGLYGRGISYIDAHLLTSAQLTDDTRLWTRDRRLREAATELSLAVRLS